MRKFFILSLEYDLNVSELLKRRTNKHENGDRVIVKSTERPQTAMVLIGGERGVEALCEAVTDMLLNDVSQFEIADIVKGLPMGLAEQKVVLIEAIRYAKSAAMRSVVRRAVAEHFESWDTLILEGFVRFRMRETVRLWERCVDKAAEELILRTEQMELLSILGAYMRMQPGKVRGVALIIRGDGSCTVTDDSDARIEYPAEAYDSLVSLLVSLSPRRIDVYDLSGGTSANLIGAIERVFEGRVYVYRATQ